MHQDQAIEEATQNFYAWELRGRGYHSFDRPVQLEPMHVPFFPYIGKVKTYVDDAHRPNIFQKLRRWINPIKETNNSDSYEEEVKNHYKYDAYTLTDNSPLTGFIINYPSGFKSNPESFVQLLVMLSGTQNAVCFEIIGTIDDIIIQFVCTEPDVLRLKTQLKAFCPEAILHEHEINPETYLSDEHSDIESIDFALSNEFTIPIKTYGKQSGETFKSFFALLEQLKENEAIFLQVLFQGTINPWGKSIVESLTAHDGKCFFLDAPEMLPLAKVKSGSPLFAVVIRASVQAKTFPRIDILTRELSSIISLQSDSRLNTLIVMDDLLSTEFDMVNRISNRSGMLLNTLELANFVHYPDVESNKLNKFQIKSKSIPNSLLGHEYILGFNIHNNITQKVTLDISRRLRHIHIIGTTGTGKSTLLTKLVCQDMELGNGIAVLDPHGDLIETILGFVPENRIQDVVIIDPSDIEYPIGFNLLEAKTEVEKIVLASDLVTAFKRQSTSWGDQMTTILSNAINAFLESSTGGTLFELRRFLLDDSFRNSFLETIDDPTIIHFWKKEYTMLRKNAISPILVRLDTFLRPKIIRNMMAQKNGINFNNLIAGNKIILIKLPQGLIGEENAHLLGTLIISKIQQAAQARQAINKEVRKSFYVYLDEFQNFITPSMSAILSGSRKYGVGLILAHQDMEQVSRYDSELANSVLANPATRICFRLGDVESRKLEHGFVNFDTQDLQNLHVGHAIAKVDTANQDFNLMTIPIDREIKINENVIREKCKKQSREKYAAVREVVEKVIFDMYKLEVFTEVEKIEDKEKNPTLTQEYIDPVVSLVSNSNSINKPLEDKAKEYLHQIEEQEKVTQHHYLQNLIKKMAESKGFKAVVEESINNGGGRVDIGLSKDKLRIGIEVSVTNTLNYEVQNILKCLNAGYDSVIMCSENATHLSNIQLKLESMGGDISIKKVLFLSPTELFAYLDSQNSIGGDTEKRIKGYRVKVKYK